MSATLYGIELIIAINSNCIVYITALHTKCMYVSKTPTTFILFY